MKNKLVALLFLLLATASAAAQNVQQSGLITPGHIPVWVTNGVIQDGGSAQTPNLGSIGTVGQGPTICANSGPNTGPYNQLCLAANSNSAAQLVLQNFDGAAAQTLQFSINGFALTLPTGVNANLAYQVGNFTSGHCLQASGTTGGLADSGAVCGSGGGGGTPGGANTQIQYNNNGAFGGITGATSNGTIATFKTGDIQLGGSSSGVTTFTSANTGATNFSLNFPAVNDTLAALGTVQTWSAAQTFSASGIALLGSSTGATTFASANAGASNFTITYPAATGTVALTANANVASVSNSDGTLTISPTTGAVVASLALANSNTWNAAQTFANNDIKLVGSSTGATTFNSANAGASNFTLTFPAASDTLVARATTDSLTNKTLTSSTNSLGGVTAAFGSDAKGDIYTNSGSSNILQRLGIGSTNQLLTVASGLPAWASNIIIPGTLTTNGSIISTVRSSGASTVTASATTDYFFCLDPTSNAITLNLPGSPATGLTYLVKDCTGQAATHAITVTPNSGNIDGSATFVMSTNYQSIGATYTGSQWSVN